jgi:hypothetical protein
MRPWIAVAYSAPVAAAMAVFLIYPIGQGSFSDGYAKYYRFAMVALLVYCYALSTNSESLFNLNILLRTWSNPKVELYLKGEHPNFFINLPHYYFKINSRISLRIKKRNVKVNSFGKNTESLNTGGDGGNNGDPNNKETDNPLLKNSNCVKAKQVQ